MKLQQLSRPDLPDLSMVVFGVGLSSALFAPDVRAHAHPTKTELRQDADLSLSRSTPLDSLGTKYAKFQIIYASLELLLRHCQPALLVDYDYPDGAGRVYLDWIENNPAAVRSTITLCQLVIESLPACIDQIEQDCEGIDGFEGRRLTLSNLKDALTNLVQLLTRKDAYQSAWSEELDSPSPGRLALSEIWQMTQEICNSKNDALYSLLAQARDLVMVNSYLGILEAAKETIIAAKLDDSQLTAPSAATNEIAQKLVSQGEYVRLLTRDDELRKSLEMVDYLVEAHGLTADLTLFLAITQVEELTRKLRQQLYLALPSEYFFEIQSNGHRYKVFVRDPNR